MYYFDLTRPTSLQNSIITIGIIISPAAKIYSFAGSITRPNAIRTGVNNTSETRAIDVIAARFKVLLLKGLILNKDLSERILNA